MREPAVPAPDRQVTGAYNNVMRAGDMTVPAYRILFELPDRILPDLCQDPGHIHILNAGDEDPGRSAAVTGHLCLIRNRLDDLVCDLFAMIAVSTIFREDEPVTHGR